MNATQKGLSAVLIILSLAVPLLAYKWPQEHEPTGWLLVFAIVAAFVIVAGKYCKGLWRGVLVDSRNQLSLSRFQMVLWTLVILPGWFAVVFHNLALERTTDALTVDIPNDVLILLGISTVSMVGSPMVRQKQEKAAPEAGDVDKASKAAGEGKVVVGKCVRNDKPEDANWGDLLKGETAGDFDTLDLAKVQMFLFTLLLGLGYAFSLAKLFANTDGKIAALPPISEGMTMLLGISNTAYLTNKAVK